MIPNFRAMKKHRALNKIDFCDFLNAQRPIVFCFQTDGALTFRTGCKYIHKWTIFHSCMCNHHLLHTPIVDDEALMFACHGPQMLLAMLLSQVKRRLEVGQLVENVWRP